MEKLEEIKVQLIYLKDGSATIDQCAERIINLFKIQLENCWQAAHQAGRFEGKGIAEENWQTFEEYYKDNFEYEERNPDHCLLKGCCDDKICFKNLICNYDERR